MAKITYENKVALNVNSDIADINKVNASDLNEIKNVVNENDDNTTTNTNNIADNAAKIGTLSNLNTTDKSNLVGAINEVNTNDIRKSTYSTDEKVIGKWTDGKILYRKTYVEFSYTTGTQFDDITFETNTNMNIKRSYGYVVLNGFEVNIPTPDVGFGAISNVNKNTSGLIYMNRTHGTYGTLQSLAVTVEYTKTTD